jgi:hypothetical protein
MKRLLVAFKLIYSHIRDIYNIYKCGPAKYFWSVVGGLSIDSVETGMDHVAEDRLTWYLIIFGRRGWDVIMKFFSDTEHQLRHTAGDLLTIISRIEYYYPELIKDEWMLSLLEVGFKGGLLSRTGCTDIVGNMSRKKHVNQLATLEKYYEHEKDAHLKTYMGQVINDWSAYHEKNSKS